MFHRHVAQLKPRIMTFAYYTLGNRQLAEDVVQEVLERWWLNRRRIEGEPTPWVMRVTRNACFDAIRRRRTKAELQLVTEPVAKAIDPEHATMFRNDLVQALRQLKEPERSIVILREVQGMSYQEISLAMDVSLDRVRVYLYRGRRWLREALSHYREEQEDEACVVLTSTI